jgi:conjugal transfer mating pair stabilization protein TraN
MRLVRSTVTLALAGFSLLHALGAHAGDGTCVRLSERCIEGPETRVINGQAITRACWRYQSVFDCASTAPVNDCAKLIERGCVQIGSRCIDTLANGQCALFEQTYSCKVASGATQTITHCGTQSFCVSGNCFDTGYAPDADFAKAVAMLEASREAGQYLDPASLQVFNGHANRCRKKLFGLVNCCDKGGSESSLFSNLNLILGAGGHALGAIGSTYTYDALFVSEAPQAVLAGFEALFGVGGGSSALAGVLAGDLSVELFVQSLVPGPWSIAILAIQLSGVLSCAQDEQVLAMKRDARLCQSVGSYCSSRIPIVRVCIEKTESHCCFNSRLARIINEEGRAQLGRGWGSPESPQCSGFTLAEFQTLDFSKMNLAEFYAEIVPTLPDSSAINTRARQKIESYFAP